MATGQETSYARNSAPVIAGFASTSQTLMDRIASAGAAKAINEMMNGLDVHGLAQGFKLNMPKMPVNNVAHDGSASRVASGLAAPNAGVQRS